MGVRIEDKARMTFQVTYSGFQRRLYEAAGVKYDETATIQRVNSLNGLFAQAEGMHTQRAAIVAEGKAAAQGLVPATDANILVSLSPEATARLATDQTATANTTKPEAPPVAPAATTTYPKGSVESENVQMAVGMSQAARTNIETLNLGVGIYNGAMRMLNDTAKLDTLVAGGKSHIADVIVYQAQKSIKNGLQFASGALGKMNAEFAVTGTTLTRTADGVLKTGDYVQSKNDGGWSISVKSTGEVKATANGVDVSDQVSDSSSSGFKWSDVIAKRQTAKATADTVALTTLTQVASGADKARTEASARVRQDEKTQDTEEPAFGITAGQIALQALTSGRMLDTSA